MFSRGSTENLWLIKQVDVLLAVRENIQFLALPTPHWGHARLRHNVGRARLWRALRVVGHIALLVTAGRSVGQGVCLCIATFEVNVRFCRCASQGIASSGGRAFEEPGPSSFAPLAIGLLPARMSDDNSPRLG